MAGLHGAQCDNVTLLDTVDSKNAPTHNKILDILIETEFGVTKLEKISNMLFNELQYQLVR